MLEPVRRARCAARAASASRDRARARARETADSSLPAVTRRRPARSRARERRHTPPRSRAGLAAGAEGAGLIRTELAFLDAPGWPSRTQHVQMLAPLLAGLAGRTATVRVLDFGGDKVPPFLRDEPRRGIELLLAYPGAFRAQLAAIARAGRPAATCACCSPWSGPPGTCSVTRAMLAAPRPRGGARRDDRAARGGRGGAPRSLPSAISSASARTTSPTPRSVRTASRTARRRPTTRACSRHIAAHRRGGARGRYPARGLRRGGVGPDGGAAARGPRGRRAERGAARVGSVRGLGARARLRRGRGARAAAHSRRRTPPRSSALARPLVSR